MPLLHNALSISHQYIGAHLREGGRALDATCGNSHDTLFLSDLVGASGAVYGFDIQPAAIENTKKRLMQQAKYPNTQLFLAGHETMDQYVSSGLDAVMFNFGYLPGSDRKQATHETTDILAIQKALALLKPGGIMTLCIYCGGETGFSEKEAILAYVSLLDAKRFTVLRHAFFNQPGDPPECVVVEKLETADSKDK